MAGLNGRLTRLEAMLKPGGGNCRACGLRHASGPLTIARLRGILRVAGGTGTTAASGTRLCLCDPCCGDPRDRALARLSHGVGAADSA